MIFNTSFYHFSKIVWMWHWSSKLNPETERTNSRLSFDTGSGSNLWNSTWGLQYHFEGSWPERWISSMIYIVEIHHTGQKPLISSSFFLRSKKCYLMLTMRIKVRQFDMHYYIDPYNFMWSKWINRSVCYSYRDKKQKKSSFRAR